MSSPRTHEDVAINRELWAVVNEQYTDHQADQKWAQDEIRWGLFGTPEERLGTLGPIAEKRIVELGCGTAYFSAWLRRRGARPIGVDLSHEQLVSARRCQRRFGVTFPLVEADGAVIPLAADCADLVVSEYGASVWCDPRRWVAEAARILRPGGRLVFLVNSPLVTMCVPAAGGYAQDQLLRAQRDLYRTRWPGGGVEFHPSHSTWVDVLGANGFVVEALHELYADPDAPAAEYYDIATPEWAGSWPVEDLWVCRSA